MFNRRISFWSAVFVVALVAVPASAAGRGGGSHGHAAMGNMHMANMANMHMANTHMTNTHMANMHMANKANMHMVTPSLRTPRITTPVLKSGFATNRVSSGVRTFPAVVNNSRFPTTVSPFRHHDHRHLPSWNPYASGNGSSDGGGSGGGGFSNSPYESYVSPYYDSPNGVFLNPYAAISGLDAAAADQTQTQPEQGRQVEVIVPNPNAAVWFNGTKSSKLGERRYFSVESRPTASVATVKAVWSEAGQTTTVERNINVNPGANIVVDFRKAGPTVVSGP